MEDTNSEINLPKEYADAAISQPLEYSQYNKPQIQWNSVDPYKVYKKIGRGKYSEVFEGFRNEEKLVVKLLKPVKKRKFYREIKILQNLQGGPNIIDLLDIVREPVAKICALVFEHIENEDYKVFYPKLCDFDIRYYLYELLRGLDYAHSKGIIHRDVKPSNIMIDHSIRKLKIIDWGLAEFYQPNREYNVSVASRFYKGPELLVNQKIYHYGLDIWGVGAMMAGMIFRKEPFFKGEDNYDQLAKIVKVLGYDAFNEYVQRYNIDLDPYYEDIIPNCPARRYEDYINENNRHLVSPEAIDLLHNILDYEQHARPTAREAMAHPYFEPVVRMYTDPDNIAPESPEETTAEILNLFAE